MSALNEDAPSGGSASRSYRSKPKTLLKLAEHRALGQLKDAIKGINRQLTTVVVEVSPSQTRRMPLRAISPVP
jgi:hypothetical protein